MARTGWQRTWAAAYLGGSVPGQQCTWVAAYLGGSAQIWKYAAEGASRTGHQRPRAREQSRVNEGSGFEPE